MSVKAQILNDIKAAMKAGNSFERDTLRMINSAFKQIEVDERVELDDARIFTILQSEIKRRNESATQYKSGGRDDLAQKELGEIEIISRYLPKQLSDDELNAKISELIAQNGLNGIKDLGLLMKLAKDAIGSACDGKRMSEAAKKALS
ncbi:GatB/YqeY domain-containing protein [Campylobacter vicugnae]|uniref:GatB/YqeY domain-containing protein n=1 Tax=Campylobacter vicugnae TaxID=1660076 RepID=UPI000A32FD35|nr:GatB/YqeY domain-containing protein [Campylobacter sp. RM8835]